MRAALLPLLLLTLAGTARGQDVGTCEPATAEAYLEGRDVRARILNDGGLFWRGDPFVYEVPKGGGVQSLFTATLWVAGLVDGEARASASLTGPWEFWPGPLPADGTAPADCAPYDRLWHVTREEVATYDRAGFAAADLRDWPAPLGAPVLDGDGVPGNYDLAAGDRPAILGDASVWWVMNDRGNVHRETDSPPIGLEVRGTAFAFDEPGVIGRTTFYRYRLTHRGDAPLDSAYAALDLLFELGNYEDDRLGSDTTLHMGYVYNADDDDEGGYGPAPPAVGVTVLQGARMMRDGREVEPRARHGMTAFIDFIHGNAGVLGHPQTAAETLNYMRGRWRDGRPVTYGGDGRFFSNTPTRFFYPGDPVTDAFWSMRNMDGSGTAANWSDGAGLVVTGPFSLQPGETEEVVFAIVWSRGADHLDSVRQLREDVAHVRGVREAILTPRVRAASPPAPRPTLAFEAPSPNPVRTHTTLRYRLPRAASVRLAVYDASGREALVLADGARGEGPHAVTLAAGRLASGVYFARLEVDGHAFTHPFVVVR